MRLTEVCKSSADETSELVSQVRIELSFENVSLNADNKIAPR
jgi:hypothetical protein